MSIKDFYIDFDFTELYKPERKDPNANLKDISNLGVDKVYLSGDQPAILFKEVQNFNDETILKDIARTHHLSWNYRKVFFLFVLSKAEVRIYNCSKKPFNYENTNIKINDELEKLEVAKAEYYNVKALHTIKEVFSRVAVDCGTLWISDNSIREKVSLQDRIDKYLVKSLLNAARELKALKLKDDIIHSLLMRSIFIMYLEDKGAAKETSLYKSIMNNASSYLDILDSKIATYAIFNKLEEHFNGNVFPLASNEEKVVTEKHLSIIKKCLFDGDLSGTPKLFHEWRLFRFDIIQIELLSEIYEHFLEEFKEQKKEEGGQYYTPPSLVELILNEKLKVNNESNWEFKVLDPACGSGIFLVESFKRLVKRWENANPTQQIKFSELRNILERNIFGIEVDRLAIRVTAFSLYLALLEHLNPRTLWLDKRYKFPYLIYDPADESLKKQGRNLYRQDSIGEMQSDAFGHIDLVVGNPPFGSRISNPFIKDYCIKYGFGKDMVIPFLHKAVDFAKEGSIALIFNSKILTNTELPFQNFRRWLFNDNYVEKVYNFSIFRRAPKTFGGQLFSSAVGPVSIAFYQKKPPENPSPSLEYWAPKSYVKNNLIEGIIIDATDIKFLPREECQIPDSKIWKIAMWGTLEDFKLITKLDKLPRLQDLIIRFSLKNSVGIQFLNDSTITPIKDQELSKMPYIKPDSIQRYATTKFEFIPLTKGVSEKSESIYKQYYDLKEENSLKKIDVFRRIGKNKAVYQGPHILVKSGLSDKKICASYINEDCLFSDKVLGISGGSKRILKSITALINSNISSYYLFLISASIGIEREEIKPNEVYELPINIDDADLEKLAELFSVIQNRIYKNYPLKVDISDLEKDINQFIFDFYSLTKNERILIEDFLSFSQSLLFDGHKSFALKPITVAENKSYGSLLSKELNNFLSSDKYTVNSSVFDIQKSTPLNIVKLSFDKKKNDTTVFDSKLYDKYLNAINQYTLSSLTRSIYIQKQIKYYEANSIYIIKPNQKRFWSGSMAINDANELINEILKMA
jgi:type I restriction-modification system DNA methylase subunit